MRAKIPHFACRGKSRVRGARSSFVDAIGMTILRSRNPVASKADTLACIKFAMALVACSGSSAGAAQVYEFEKHKTSQLYSGRIHFPDFSGRDRQFAMYRTRIRHAVEKGVSFAGQYAVVTIGCGTDCAFGYIVDVSTGRVVELPRGGEEFMNLRYDYQVDSSLIIARWRSMESGRCYDEAFVWQNDRFEKTDKKDVGDAVFCLEDWPKRQQPTYRTSQ